MSGNTRRRVGEAGAQGGEGGQGQNAKVWETKQAPVPAEQGDTNAEGQPHPDAPNQPPDNAGTPKQA